MRLVYPELADVGYPYSQLEDLDAQETAAWVKAQQGLTTAVLGEIPVRATIRSRVEELWDYPKAAAPFERGERWFQARNTGLQPQAVLYVGPAPDRVHQILIDPNELSTDGTVSLAATSVSSDGGLVAYALSEAGSDWMTWRVRAVDTLEDTADLVQWSKFGVATWRKDGSGFYYGALPPPAAGGELTQVNRPPQIMFHRLGSPQSNDEVVFECAAEPDWFPTATVTDDGRYLVVTIQRGTGTETQVMVLDLAEDSAGFRTLVEGFRAKALVVWNAGRRFYLMTELEAERGRLVAVDLENTREWVDVIPETDATLAEVHVCGGMLVCHYLRDAHSELRVHDLDGSLVRELPLPGYVSLVADPLGHGGVEGRPESNGIHFRTVSFFEPGSIWSHDLPSGETKLLETSPSALDSSRFVTEQVFVKSDDGTQVPMFVTHLSTRRPNGDAAVLLYGYGGFDIALTPSFSPTFAAWLDRGGVLAVANLRGGGEYGRAWHDGGRLARKQNVFDDFCACARWLAGTSGWSRPGRIGIAGGSNGGLLVGACITQHPELFGAAVADVGVFDMLRFHKFTIGWAWKSDYGDPDEPEQREWLQSYSPLHNVRDGTCYPPTLLLTGDHDDRVVPSHSYKFAARLQAAQGCGNPILLRVETSAGHGAGKPTAKLVAEAADRLAFLELALGAP